MIDMDMSPYAAFVWPAWALTALALGVLVALTAAAARRWSRELKALERETTVPEDDR